MAMLESTWMMRGTGAAKKRSVALYQNVDLLLRSIDPRVLIGFVMVLMSILMSQDQTSGTTGYLATIGISPRGFSLVLAFCGCIVVRAPDTRWFTLLTIPFVFYLAAAIGFINSQSDLSYVPVVIYIGFYVLILRTGAEKRG